MRGGGVAGCEAPGLGGRREEGLPRLHEGLSVGGCGGGFLRGEGDPYGLGGRHSCCCGGGAE